MASIALVEAQPILRDGLLRLLKDHPTIKTLKSFGDAETLMHDIENSHHFDIVVTELDLPGMGGFEALDEMHRRWPQLPVVVLTSLPAAVVAVRCLRSGARGFVSKSQEPVELFEAIAQVLLGGRALGALHIDLIIKAAQQSDAQLPHERLSNREFEIMKRIASGDSLQNIANDLFISPKTVSTYRRRMMEKMDFERNAQLTEYSLKHSLIEFAA